MGRGGWELVCEQIKWVGSTAVRESKCVPCSSQFQSMQPLLPRSHWQDREPPCSPGGTPAAGCLGCLVGADSPCWGLRPSVDGVCLSTSVTWGGAGGLSRREGRQGVWVQQRKADSSGAGLPIRWLPAWEGRRTTSRPKIQEQVFWFSAEPHGMERGCSGFQNVMFSCRHIGILSLGDTEVVIGNSPEFLKGSDVNWQV